MENFGNLYKEFMRIKKMGWIKSKGNGFGGAGRTFEYQLGKTVADSFSVPDFGDIEIKTKHTNSLHPITLFSAAPDGKFLFETKRIVDKYGYPSLISGRRELWATITAKHLQYIGKFYQFKLVVNHYRETINLHVYNRDKLIDNQTYWSFSLIKEKTHNKIQKLALVHVKSKFIDNELHFCYYQIKFYILKDFDTFLTLLEDGYISIQFKVGSYKDKNRFGKMYDHGTGFQISSNNLLDLYHLADLSK